MITLSLNGEEKTFPEPLTIAELVEKLDIQRASVAVEVNRAIVPRSDHPHHRLRQGDRVEIVTFVGGG